MFGTKLKYSFNWSYSIIQKLTEAHPRATELLLEELHISTQQLTFLLALGRKEYYLIREYIRKVDRLLKLSQKSLDERAIRLTTTWALSRLLYESAKMELKAFYDYLKPLTDEATRTIIEEPNIRGEGGGAIGAEPLNLLSDPATDSGEADDGWSINVYGNAESSLPGQSEHPQDDQYKA